MNSTPLCGELAACTERLEALARAHGLTFAPVSYELVPDNFMLEVAAYGLPVRMRHWSFGVRYIHQLASQKMGHSHIFEVMFPGRPCRAFFQQSNSLAATVLVTAHVIGHADFAHNNLLFQRAAGLLGGHILEASAARAAQLEQAVARHGVERVETLLDAALALENHVDLAQPLERAPYPTWTAPATAAPPEPFARRYGRLPGAPPPASAPARRERPPVPPAPEPDLLWFLAIYAPDLEDWERELLLAVRAEACYFAPIHACHIMNEGWAAYWHARLLREADFLPAGLYVEALQAHSDVVRPYAAGEQLALLVNPYHLGFSIWEQIVAQHGLERALQVRAEEDDAGFIRNHLDDGLAAQLDLLVYESRREGPVRIASRELPAIHEAILGPRYRFGAPAVSIHRLHPDHTLELRHDHRLDGRGLDVPRAEQVLQYLARLWGREVRLYTVDFRGVERLLAVHRAAAP